MSVRAGPCPLSPAEPCNPLAALSTPVDRQQQELPASTSSSSIWRPPVHRAPSPLSAVAAAHRGREVFQIKRDDTPSLSSSSNARPTLKTAESALSVASVVSAASTTSDLILSATDPMPSPFFVPPPDRRPGFAWDLAEDRDNGSTTVSPFPRPDSPLPALPISARTPTEAETIAHNLSKPPLSVADLRDSASLTAPEPLAEFEARQAEADSEGGCSWPTHRTSSDTGFNLDLPRQRNSRESWLSRDEIAYESASYNSSTSSRDWVGIEVRPADHDIPESYLVRSSSGQLVGARHMRAASAMDLRTRFKQDAQQSMGVVDDVAITIGALTNAGDKEFQDDEERARRSAIRQGKRPLEGARANPLYPETAPLEQTASFLDPSLAGRNGHGAFAYNARGPLIRDPPRSAPPQTQAKFAERQVQQPPPHQQRVFPLPLRLLQQTKRSAEAFISPAFSAASAFARSGGGGGGKGGTVADSDVDSLDASPMFGSDLDGTVRTAPSTPNDTPVLQECFDADDMASTPVPHGLGSSATAVPPLAGLGLDFGAPLARSDDRVEQFPLVPLRQSRRVSLPPLAVRRRSVRHKQIPSLAVSSPPLEPPGEDNSIGTSSSTLSSQDSAVDPTASPSRRLSRRLPGAALPASAPEHTGARSSVHFDKARAAAFPSLQKVDTPTSPSSSSSNAGPSIPTPQHLLVSPTPPSNMRRDPSFSFSPAPLRLVKVQLLRAAGYGTTETPSTRSPPAVAADARPASLNTPASATVEITSDAPPTASVGRTRFAATAAGWYDDLADLLAAPSTWADEVLPAKLAFLAGFFLFCPWLWLLGGWYLRPLDGEFPSQRGQRCRDPQCGCGRIMRGSGSAHVHVKKAHQSDDDRYAGLDKWVFMNRVAATAGGVTVAVLVAVAIWAAASA